MSVEKIVHIERSHRRVLLIALSVIAVFALYQWILAPHTRQLLATQKYDSSLDAAIKKADFMSTVIGKKQTEVSELTKKAYSLRSQLFTQNEARRFSASVPSIASQSGCTVVSIGVLPDVQHNAQNDTAGVTLRRAVVTITGGFNGVTAFLGALQNYERKIWIDSVKIDAEGAGKLKCQVLLTIYCIERVENSLYE